MSAMGESSKDVDSAAASATATSQGTAPGAAVVVVETLPAVAERLKFFFSDANLRQDFFMRKYLMVGSGNGNVKTNAETPFTGGDNMVPVEALLRFNTIKQHTDSAAVVVQAAKDLLSNLLTVSDDDTKLGLVVPFTEAKMDENIPLTLYLSNLPLDEQKKKYTVSADDVRNLFENMDHVAIVKLRFRPSGAGHADDLDDDDLADLQPSKQQEQQQQQQQNGGHKKVRRVPTGAALVEFDSIEELERATSSIEVAQPTTTTTANQNDKGSASQASTKRSLQLSGNTLTVTLLRDYIDSRKTKNKDEDKNNKRKNSISGSSSSKPGNGTNEANAEDEEVELPESPTFTFDWKPGCVVSIKGIASTEPCDREGILASVAAALDTTVQEMKSKKAVYVDYSRGQTDGAIRFSEPSEDVKKVCDQLQNGTLLIGGSKVGSATILDGDDEKSYWDSFMAFKTKQMQQRKDERKSNKYNKRTRRN